MKEGKKGVNSTWLDTIVDLLRADKIKRIGILQINDKTHATTKNTFLWNQVLKL